ncbi:MGMT family protein [Tessaracoccus antarcticus]|uniref:MGMT family protein n=1 Tax=Tessaracoccus antarcticus TaxID=2479848 RepID=UPI0013149BC4|nr:MGMT family protein [Tessaracoccus antarcticus]
MADDALVERILRAVEQVPQGRIVSYGDIAGLVGVGPRHVGNVLGRWGSGVAWWRVTNSQGELPAPLLPEALPHWEAEGVSLKTNGRGCRIERHRADLLELGVRWERAIADLPH